MNRKLSCVIDLLKKHDNLVSVRVARYILCRVRSGGKKTTAMNTHDNTVIFSGRGDSDNAINAVTI